MAIRNHLQKEHQAGEARHFENSYLAPNDETNYPLLLPLGLYSVETDKKIDIAHIVSVKITYHVFLTTYKTLSYINLSFRNL